MIINRIDITLSRLKQGFDSPRERHPVLICEPGMAPFRLAKTAFSSTSLLPLIRIAVSSTSITLMSDCR